MELSKNTRDFLRDWLDWVERGAPNGKPYFRFVGLCANADRFDRSFKVTDELKDYFLNSATANSEYPFGEEQYGRDAANNSMHQCPERLAFARQYASEKVV